ncbi:MAG: elongation factor P maturation arginine rhamnosyltransferase EarP [Spirochaetales bacterium]|nr:elongation factor P maturation arginine rhamnosyltransferase EarP [Spirochaetales bacterium]
MERKYTSDRSRFSLWIKPSIPGEADGTLQRAYAGDRRKMKRLTRSIDITTRVVDNYGDAGVALRLLRSLSLMGREFRIRLFIDDPSILEILLGGGWRFGGAGTVLRLEALSVSVFDWSDLQPLESEDGPDLLIEMFGGGLPDSYLPAISSGRPEEAAGIVWLNLEHLTAEHWASDYHLTPSFSPDPHLNKFFFMPGFREGLGGLIFDSAFLSLKRKWDGLDRAGKRAERRKLLDRWEIPCGEAQADDIWVSVFSYEKDFAALVEYACRANDTTLLLSPGKGTALLEGMMRERGAGGKCLSLPFLPQGEWDELLFSCDINLVRGEESLSRAALSGRPFLWQAYPFAEEGQMEKVEAFVDLLCPGNREISGLFVAYNQNRGCEVFSHLMKTGASTAELFKNFAKKLENFGNCADQLIQFSDNYIRFSKGR